MHGTLLLFEGTSVIYFTVRAANERPPMKEAWCRNARVRRSRQQAGIVASWGPCPARCGGKSAPTGLSCWVAVPTRSAFG